VHVTPEEQRQHRAWIEQGKQIGKSFSINKPPRRFYVRVAIQKQQGAYRVIVDEIDETLMAAEQFEMEENRTFASLDEAIAFIENTTSVKLTELAPSKGQKWFR
jgi:hypothetical protein